MISQYPHTIKFFIPAESTRDANGDWVIPATPPTELVKKGRAELKHSSSVSTAYIHGEDGVQLQYQCIIYLPLPVPILLPGTQVQVWDGNRLIAESNIKQFSKGQLNARVWI